MILEIKWQTPLAIVSL